ncbi:MAG TPA: MMPL family transporter [Gemmatimonadales bacterium]|nr:MMPL family transporter [Gemmatimonadales bacterium]
MIAFPARALIRWRGWVIAAWASLAVLFAPRACHVQRVLEVRGHSTKPTEAIRAGDAVRDAFPKPFAEYVAIVVHGPVPWTNRRFGIVLDSIKAATASRMYISQIISLQSIGESSFVSEDRHTTFLIAALGPQHIEDVNNSFVPDLRNTLRDLLSRIPGAASFDVKVTGNAALDYDVRTISAEDTEHAEQRAVPLTMAVLVVAFGALVAAALPAIVGVLAITIALGLVTIAARYQTMSVFVLNITTMVGLGVGVDYSLLIVTRFREELNRGLSAADAAVRTIETAGSAVVTSGVTVIVGFLALVLTTPLTDTRSVGTGGLLVVLVAVLLATTFLPATLAVLGREIDRPRWLARPLARFHAPTGWERWARWLGRRPWRAVAAGGIAIALLTSPLTQIRLGLPAANWFPPQSESGQGLAALQAMGASGVIYPVRIVVQLPEGESALSARRIAGLKVLTDSLAQNPRVKEVRGVASIKEDMSRLQLAIFYSDEPAARASNPTFFDAYLSADDRTTLIDVIPGDTVSLTGIMDVARRARVIARGVRSLNGAEVLVGGYAAANLDTQVDLLRRLPRTVGFILGITAIMMFFAFRSLLVPLKAVLLNCLSVGAAFGVTVLVFQHGYGGGLFGLEGPTQAIWGVVPVLVFATVFGLSMDYEVFLLTRVKEVFDKTGRNDYATMEGLSATASTITSAALIMILVFGTFAFARVLAVQMIGFGLAMAVLLDATLIRMVLVPAIMHIAGRWNWWPGVRAPRVEPDDQG